MNSLEESIKKTLIYFDLFGHPLTKEELFFNLWQPPHMTYEDFLSALSYPSAYWESKNGFYFLPGRGDIVDVRHSKAYINDKKFKIAARAAKRLRWVPYLRAIFVCNSVSMFTAGTDSDIDLFIVAAPGRVWLVRLFANLILRLSGQRVYGHHIADRICLSFFVDQNNLSVHDLKIKDDDVYLAYWLIHLVPLYDKTGVFNTLSSANSWLKKFLPYSEGWGSGTSAHSVKEGCLIRGWRKFWEMSWQGKYGDMLEGRARKIQEPKIKKNLGRCVEETGVVLGSGIIKLHNRDRRREYYRAWKNN